MNKAILLAVVTVGMIGIVGCGNLDTGDSSYNETYNDNSGQDLSTDYGEGTVIICNDANCSVDEDNSDNSDNSRDDQDDTFTGDKNDDGTHVVGDYPGPNVSQSLCNSLGFFYCTISNTCNNIPRDGSAGTCSR